MSTPAAKRRRIDAASSTLSKPFRSPFKAGFKSPLKAQASTDDTRPATPSSLSTSTTTIHTDKTQPIAPPNPLHYTPTLPNKAINLPAPLALTLKTQRAKKPFTSPGQAAALNADPDVAPLLRKQRELEKRLREVKEALDTAEQARKIEKDSRKNGPGGVVDGELVELIEKWKGASRQAAEELFGKVRDRVNRMGGPRAWKEAQKKQEMFQQGGWDQEDQKNDDSDDGGKDVEKRDLYAEYGVDEETENEKSQRENGLGDTGEMPGQEDEFTMAMMLRTLNVDLDIIGYDRQEQRWKP